MNAQKLIAIIVAIAINVAVLGWFHAWSAATVANAAARGARADRVVTLPGINVHPDAEQLRELHRDRAPAPIEKNGAGGRVACVVMPYYSFASACGDGSHA